MTLIGTPGIAICLGMLIHKRLAAQKTVCAVALVNCAALCLLSGPFLYPGFPSQQASLQQFLQAQHTICL